jgi:hypothetical protein
MRLSRRTLIALAALATPLLAAGALRAEDLPVPVALQVELMVKVAAYDNNLPARAGGKVRVLLVTKAGNADSTRAAAEMAGALAGKATIANLPHEESTLAFTDAPALARACRTARAAIVYLAPGFGDGEIAAIASALDGVDVLTVSSLPGYVPKGIVLGFDLVSGKPKLLVHLTQAKRQRVALSADVLKLMKVYE